MQTIDKKNPLGKNIVQVSSALFVLSQFANKRKVEIGAIKEQLNTLQDSESSVKDELLKQLKQLSKKQQYFHSERTLIIRSLIQQNMVAVLGYVESGDYKYGVVKIAKHKFYVILNNKIVEKLNLKKLGDELVQIDTLSDEELENIMPKKEAERVFNLFLAKVRMVIKKNKSKKLAEKSAVPIEEPEKVLSQSISASGSVVVIKKRKFSGLAAAHKNSIN